MNYSFVKLLIVLITVNWYYMFWQRRCTANNLVVHINVVLVIIKLYLEHCPLSLVGHPHSLFPQHVIQQLKINFFVQFCKIVHVHSSLNRSVFYDFWCLRPCGALTHFAISLRMLRFLQVFKFESFSAMRKIKCIEPPQSTFKWRSASCVNKGRHLCIMLTRSLYLGIMYVHHVRINYSSFINTGVLRKVFSNWLYL